MGVYSQILRRPGIAVIVAATLLGRLPIGISGLAILLYVREATGSFAAAGLATGALALGSAAAAPLVGRVVDWRGVRALVPLAFGYASGLVLVWVLGTADAPSGVIAAASFLAGSCLPPLSSVLRGRWPSLLRDVPGLVKSAYALDAVMIQVIFVVGPLLTAAILALSGPEYALVISAGSALAGTTLLVAALASQPEPPRPEEGTRVFGLGPLAAPGLRTLVLASMPLGFCFGAIQVVLPAFSEAHGAREMSGVLIAVWAFASAAAGLLYGARPPRGASLEGVHVAFAVLLPLCVAVLLIPDSTVAMALLVPLAGAPIAPLVASRNELVERIAPRGTATEAFTWPLTSLVAGVSIGAAVTGSLTESHSWTAGVVAAVAVAGAGALVVLARRRTLAAPVAVGAAGVRP